MDKNLETALHVDPKIANGHETECVRDPFSGLMVSQRHDRITLQQKQIIIDIYRAKGNMTEACAAAGIAPRTFRIVRGMDPVLDASIAECEREFVERAKGYMLEHMARPGNYMDRVTIARRFEPGVWGDQVKHTVDINVNQLTASLGKAEALEGELVEREKQIGAPHGNVNDDRTNGINETATSTAPEGITPPPTPPSRSSPST